MFKILLLVMVVFCVGLTSGVYAQDAGQKTQDLIAALDKTKYKKKEKKNISIEIYIDIKNEPVVKNNIAEYAGVYESGGSGYRLELRISTSGAVEGGGHDTTNFDNSQKLNFTLKDARIEGALLAGTKVYENGETQRFEAVFANRTVASGKNANEIATRDTIYGLGFVQYHNSIDGNTDPNAKWMNRVFLEFKQ